jgi:hypothetical protein
MAPEGYSSRGRNDSPTAVRERRSPEESRGKGRDYSRTAVLDTMGMATILLAILGLSGIVPPALSILSLVCLGVSLIKGGASTARDARLIDGGVATRAGNWFGIEALLGVVGIFLAILAFFLHAADLILSLASMAMGTALAAGGFGTLALNAQLVSEACGADVEERQDLTRAAAIELSVGTISIGLGIIASLGVIPMVLSLVAALLMGAAVTVAGGLVAVRVAKVLGSS